MDVNAGIHVMLLLQEVHGEVKLPYAPRAQEARISEKSDKVGKQLRENAVFHGRLGGIGLPADRDTEALYRDTHVAGGTVKDRSKHGAKEAQQQAQVGKG